MTVLRGPRVVMAEAALLGVTLAVVYGFSRLFFGGSWVVPLAAAGLITHAASSLVRRQRLSVLLQVVVVAVAMVLLSGWVLAPDTLRYGLPTAATFDAFGDAVAQAAEEYPEARAPTEATDGFVLASMVGVAVTALMANIAAFTLRAPLQALVPPFTLFALCSLLGSGERQVASALVFTVASLAFVLCMRGLDATTSTTWLPGDERRGPDALLRLGGVLVALTAAVATIVGPVLPGAADEAMWTWRGGGGQSARFVVSPLVDIRSRIVNQSREVAFVVQSPEPSYWRLMALDEFDGRMWRISTNFRSVSGNFGATTQPPGATVVDQRIEIRSLGSEYLPAAYRPFAVDAPNRDVTWDDRSATLLLDRPTHDGYQYSVSSVMPDHTPEQLRAADTAPPSSVTDRYLQLPELDDRVVQLAADVTAGASTNYDRAIALQDFFREEFTYSTDIEDGSGEAEIVSFLFERRQGYCEQFAASFAAMARSLGMPARVAVGFTEGDQSSANSQFFTVRGENAHAWPEIYFSGVGWVPFEPTPGRAAPGAEGWTNVSSDPEDDTEPAPGVTVGEDPVTPTTPPTIDEGALPEFGDQGAAPVDDERGGPVHPALIVAGAAPVAAAAWTGGVSGLVLLRRRRRRQRAGGDPAAQVQVAWTEAVESLARRGHAPGAAETYQEYAARVAPFVPALAPDLLELARLTSRARYAPGPVDEDDIESATAAAQRVVRGSIEHLPRWRRALDRADPRSLRRARPRRARQQAAVIPAS